MELSKDSVKKIFMEEAFNASAAKAFSVNKESYHYKNLEEAFEKFYSRLTQEKPTINEPQP